VIPNDLVARLEALERIAGSSLPPAPVPEQRQVVVNPMKPSTLITPAAMCDLLQVDARTLRRLRHAGTVPAPLQIGRALRWRRKDVDAWLEGGARRSRR
jgi:excisionase family DNA binding protein